MRDLFRFTQICLLIIFTTSCARSTDHGEVHVERRQLFLLPSAQINSASGEAYAQTKREAEAKGVLDQDPAQVERVQAITKRLIPVTATFKTEAPGWEWESHVIESEELNAYCMPGGKIIFYSGIIRSLKLSDAEMAAIMGHEVAHALREHGRERMSEALIEQGALGFLNAAGILDAKFVPVLHALANLMITLPHGRGQESEADIVGLELMARAGYDPRAAVTLWQKMSAASGAHPPEVLSTHPADATRIAGIEAHLPEVLPLYLEQQTKPQ